MNNPQAKAANPFGPDAAALTYWQQRGLADFASTVAGMSKAPTTATTGGLLTGNTTAVSKPTTVADVLAAYKNNPQANAANPNGPDQAALAYWLKNGLGGFNQAVTSVAAQPLSIEDQIRRAYNNNPQAKALNPNGPDAAAIAYWKQQGLGNFNQVVSDVFAQSLASR